MDCSKYWFHWREKKGKNTPVPSGYPDTNFKNLKKINGKRLIFKLHLARCNTCIIASSMYTDIKNIFIDLFENSSKKNCLKNPMKRIVSMIREMKLDLSAAWWIFHFTYSCVRQNFCSQKVDENSICWKKITLLFAPGIRKQILNILRNSMVISWLQVSNWLNWRQWKGKYTPVRTWHPDTNLKFFKKFDG